MTIQSLLQSRKQRQPLLAQRGEVSSKAAKVDGSRPQTKTAGDLLLNLDHANVALRLRVIKGHTQVLDKG